MISICGILSVPISLHSFSNCNFMANIKASSAQTSFNSSIEQHERSGIIPLRLLLSVASSASASSDSSFDSAGRASSLPASASSMTLVSSLEVISLAISCFFSRICFAVMELSNSSRYSFGTDVSKQSLLHVNFSNSSMMVCSFP